MGQVTDAAGELRPLTAGRTRSAVARVTTGDIRRTTLWLALPVFGEQVLNSFVAIVDTFLAGRISTEATAAVGLAAYVAWLATMLFALVGTGTTALVARSMGARDRGAADRFCNQSITLAVLSGLGISALLFLLAPTFARLQNMTGATYDIAVQYLRIDAAALVFTSLTLVGGAALRGAGDTRTPMIILGAVNILNVPLSASLVFGWGPCPELGVTGIVLGTVIARFTGGVLMLAVLARGKAGLRLHRSALGLQRDPVRRILRIGVPAASDGAVMWTGHFIFLILIARLADGALGQAYYAAHIIGVRLESLTYMPSVAWAAAAATMIGQNLGAGSPARARRSGHEASLQCGVLAGLVGIAFFFGATVLFQVMHKDALVRDVGIPPFRFVALFQPMLAVSIVYIGALRGAGDTKFPLVITVLGLVLVRLPLAYVFGVVLGGGLWAAWLAMCGDFVLRALLAGVRFARGKWISLKV
jgi:putative MATE family efflux protein